MRFEIFVIASAFGFSAAEFCAVSVYTGVGNGGSCVGEHLGQAEMDGPGNGTCVNTTNGQCALVDDSDADGDECYAFFFAVPNCGGGTYETFTCGEGPGSTDLAGNIKSLLIHCV